MERSIKDRLEGLKRPVDTTCELRLLLTKRPKLEVNALESSRLARISDSDESAETSVSSNEPNAVEQSCGPNLDTLPEYVLLHLFSYLNSQDLYNISLCGPRLYNVARCGKKLWKIVIDVCNGSSPYHSRLQPFLNDFTTVLHLFKSINLPSCPAERRRDECFKLSFFKNLKSLPNLKSFILDNHSLDYKMLNFADLPECLTELRLRRINLLNLKEGHNETFHDLHLKLPNLEVLDVAYCFWVIPPMLCSFSRCSHLKRLIMLECRGMDEIMPYAAHAANLGFLELETLDLRLTSYISLNEIAVFKKLKNLKHVLLENAKRCTQNRPSKELQRMLFPRRFRTKPRRLSNYINTGLETLVVRNYSSITDETLGEIEELFRMKVLDVTGTKCTEKRIAEIQTRRPEMRILHESVIENAKFQLSLCS